MNSVMITNKTNLMNKVRGVLGIAVLAHIYAYVMYGLKCGNDFWIIPFGFVLTIFFMAGVWMCLDLIGGKRESKDGGHD